MGKKIVVNMEGHSEEDIEMVIEELKKLAVILKALNYGRVIEETSK